MSAAVLTELVNSAVWFLVGIAAGYLAGRLRREVREIREVVVDDSGEPGRAGSQGGPGGPGGVGGTGGTGGGHGGVGGPGGVGGRGGRATSHWWGQRAIGVVVILLAIATVAQAVVFERQQARLAACQTRFVEDFTAALRTRAQIGEEDRANLNTLIRDVITAQPGRARDVLAVYLQRQAELEGQRKAVPLPTLPRECGP
jgi:hypothetical protein